LRPGRRARFAERAKDLQRAFRLSNLPAKLLNLDIGLGNIDRHAG